QQRSTARSASSQQSSFPLKSKSRTSPTRDRGTCLPPHVPIVSVSSHPWSKSQKKTGPVAMTLAARPPTRSADAYFSVFFGSVWVGWVLVGSVLVGSVLVGSVLVGSVLAASVLAGSVLAPSVFGPPRVSVFGPTGVVRLAAGVLAGVPHPVR